MWEWLQHLVFCADESLFKKLKAILRQSLCAILSVCVFVFFFLYVCKCVLSRSDREADLKRMVFNWLLHTISQFYPEAIFCIFWTPLQNLQCWSQCDKQNNSSYFLYFLLLFRIIFLISLNVALCTILVQYAVRIQSLKIQQHSKFLPKFFLVAAQWKSWTILWWDDCIGSIEYLLLVCLRYVWQSEMLDDSQ